MIIKLRNRINWADLKDDGVEIDLPSLEKIETALKNLLAHNQWSPVGARRGDPAGLKRAGQYLKRLFYEMPGVLNSSFGS
jgi:hypothetical protein